MSKEKELLKEILANTRIIIDHLKINSAVSPDKHADKASVAPKLSPAKKVPAKKSK